MITIMKSCTPWWIYSEFVVGFFFKFWMTKIKLPFRSCTLFTSWFFVPFGHIYLSIVCVCDILCLFYFIYDKSNVGIAFSIYNGLLWMCVCVLNVRFLFPLLFNQANDAFWKCFFFILFLLHIFFLQVFVTWLVYRLFVHFHSIQFPFKLPFFPSTSNGERLFYIVNMTMLTNWWTRMPYDVLFCCC